ncbi:hypothetical protein Syun_012075 [Stephania yunnanensis]|uniref:Uncharacterized protein n=1 Tax=Stephania yunnanensis TaxID=152371 RepID=A0AAP0PIP1_9MAGN
MRIILNYIFEGMSETLFKDNLFYWDYVVLAIALLHIKAMYTSLIYPEMNMKLVDCEIILFSLLLGFWR